MDLAIFNDLLAGIIKTPATLMDVLGLSLLAYWLELWPRFNSKVIAPLVMALGPLTYWLFAEAASVPKTYPHPGAVLFVNGLVAGALAVVWHQQLTKRFFMPKPEEKSGPGDDKEQSSNNKETKTKL